MSIEKIIPVDKELVNIFGVNDQNLKYLKDKFKKIKINVKGNVVYISGDNGQTTDIMKILDEMLSMADRGEVIEIDRSNNRAKVKEINMVKKHIKTTKEKKGGIVSKENFIHLSNLSILDNKKSKKVEAKK